MNPSIDRVGNLIAVCGNSGSGKSTLVRHTLQQLPEALIYMKTFTTRPRRTNEDDIEYTFVSDFEYDQHQKAAKVWDGSIIYGNHYGVNATQYIDALNRGENVIFCSIPSLEIMRDISIIYNTHNMRTIQLMAGVEASAEQARSRDRTIDIGRVALDAAMSTDNVFEADYKLIPSRSLSTDKVNFLNIIRSIIL